MNKAILYCKNNASWILSTFITLIMMLVIYKIHGIYPFGNITISYHDMAQLYVSLYTHTYDVFHGTQGVFWDWYNCGGVPLVDSFNNYILNPLNLFFLFVSRNRILDYMSLFLLLKVCLSAFTMSYYIEKRYATLPLMWKALFGILYASSGYIIQYYTNIQFLDTVALFPLLMLSVDRLIEEGKRKGFFFFLLLEFMGGIQLVLMVGIYVIIYSYLALYKKSEARKKILNLGICVFLVILASAIVILPTMLAIAGTSRLGVSNSIYNTNIYYMLKGTYFYQKLFMCYGIEVVIAFLCTFFFKKNVHIRSIKKELILFCLLFVPIFIDGINIVWHVVGYVSFPMRFGFLLTFSAIVLFAKILLLIDSHTINIEKDFLRNIISMIIGGIGIATMFFCIIPLRQYGDVNPHNFWKYGIGMIVLVLLYAVIIKLNSHTRVLIFVVFCQCFLGWNILLAPEKDDFQPEMASEFITSSNYLSKVVKDMLPEDPRIARARDDSISLNANFPVILGNSSVSGWYYCCNENLRYLTQKMGHGANYTRLLSTGATVFSDALFHVRKVVSFNNTEIGGHIVDLQDNYYLKETDIYYPYGILVGNNIENWGSEEKNAFLYQNELISKIHNEAINLYETYDLANFCESNNFLLEDGRYYNAYGITVEDDRVLYFKGRKTGTNKLQIGINGEVVNINDLTIPDNTVYPGYFNNGVITLGEFENEMVYCEIVSSEPIAEGEISIAAMDINLLKEKTEEQHKYEREITPTNNGLKYKVNNTDGYPYLLLPIGFQNKFWCKVNGKFVECEPCVEDALTLIPIEEGMNEISLVYIPRGLITGAIISVIGILALIIVWKRWDAILEIKWLQNVANVCFTLLFWAIIVCIYIIPTIAEVVLRFIWNPFGI